MAQGYGPRGDQPRRATAGGRIIAIGLITTSGAGAVLAPENCVVQSWLWGGGASGVNASASGLNGSGGGGASALYKRFVLSRGQSFLYDIAAGGAAQPSVNVLGNDGGDSTLTLPSGLVVRAGGGKALGAGGIATGGDINRPGASVVSNSSAGGDAASFSDIGSLLAGGVGSAFDSGSDGGAPGAGSGGSNGAGTGAGGVGRLYYVILAR